MGGLLDLAPSLSDIGFMQVPVFILRHVACATFLKEKGNYTYLGSDIGLMQLADYFATL